MGEKLRVSVVVLCRNEEKFIAECLDSLLVNDYPKDKLEVLVCDGMSEDGTREIVREYSRNHPSIKLLDNLKKITPCAFNVGIRNAQGEVVVIVGAHALYASDYISKCAYYLEKYKVDNVGGTMIARAKNLSFLGEAIVHVLTTSFGVGNSRFRTGASKPIDVDTVFGGCYRRSLFDKIGMFNENLKSNQDLEFNCRLKRMGGKILLFPDIKATYFTRSTIGTFCKNNFRNAFWAIYTLNFVDYMAVKWRHLVPMAFVISLIIFTSLGILWNPVFIWLLGFELCLYFILGFIFSLKAARETSWRLFFVLPFLFALLHLSHGTGSFCASCKLAVSKAFWRNRFQSSSL